MKKWIALLLVFAMAISLCACGGFTSGSKDDDDDDGGSKNNGLVTAYKISGGTSISYDEDGTVTETVVPTYNDQYQLVGIKTYCDDVLTRELVFARYPDQLQKMVSYDKDGKEEYRYEYTYDDKGNELSNFGYENGEQSWGYVCTYDADGNLLTQKNYEKGELSTEYTYTYNEKGLLEQETQKWGETELRTSYTYDEQGNTLTVTSSEGDEIWSNDRYENTYENGILVKVKVYNSDDELQESIDYDADGNRILYVGYWDGEEYYREESIYENGKLVKENSYNDGVLSYEKTITYNEAGQILEEYSRYLSEDGSESKTVNTYNEQGLLTGSKEYHDGKLSCESTIEYEAVQVTKEQAQTLNKINDYAGM